MEQWNNSMLTRGQFWQKLGNRLAAAASRKKREKVKILWHFDMAPPQVQNKWNIRKTLIEDTSERKLIWQKLWGYRRPQVGKMENKKITKTNQSENMPIWGNNWTFVLRPPQVETIENIQAWWVKAQQTKCQFEKNPEFDLQPPHFQENKYWQISKTIQNRNKPIACKNTQQVVPPAKKYKKNEENKWRFPAKKPIWQK